MTVDPAQPGHLELAPRAVKLVGEILTVAVVARPLYASRRATMERPLRRSETPCAAIR